MALTKTVVLTGPDGVDVTIAGIRYIETRTPTEGENALFSLADLAERSVPLNMASGDQEIEADPDELLNKVTVEKPATMLPSNIRKNVNIGGIVGTYEGAPEPSGRKVITDLSETDVSAFATAQVVDADLLPENIKSGVNILGISGSYEGVVPSGTKIITDLNETDVAAFATAQVVDADLLPENIKAGVNILGISGSYEGFIPSGKIIITDLNETDVAAFATAQVVDANLLPENIIAGVNILGVTGTHKGFPASYVDNVTSGFLTLSDANYDRPPTFIRSYAFYGAYVLRSVYFSQASYIGSNAFGMCGSIYSGGFDNCKIIYSNAFTGVLSFVSFPLLERVYFGNCRMNLSALFSDGIHYAADYTIATYASSSVISFASSIRVIEDGFTSGYSSILRSIHGIENAMYIGANAFSNCSYVEIPYNFEKCKKIYSYAFAYAGRQASNSNSGLSLPNCELIENNAFYYTGINGELYAPKCSIIGASAFASNSHLTSANLKACESIGSSAFYGCSNLQSVIFPTSKSCQIFPYAFRNCFNGGTVSLTNIAVLSQYAFAYCSMSKLYLRYLTQYPAAFIGCYNLRDISGSGTAWQSTFMSCSKLERVNLTGRYVGGSAFLNCSSLRLLKMGALSYVSASAFYGCSRLSVIVLTSFDSRYSIGTNAFGLTPITNSTYLGYYGSFYVPQSLLSSYKALWSAYSERFAEVTDEILGLFDGELE